MELSPMLQPLSSGLPNSSMAIKEPPLLVLRDYSANVRRMLHLIERVEAAKQARAERE